MMKSFKFYAANPWTDQMLGFDYHAGDAGEAAQIIAENGNDAPLVCGGCGGKAYYKHSIGSEKCTRCGMLHDRIAGDWF